MKFKKVSTTPAGISPEESRAWAAATAVLDRVAADHERRWGVGRLETLVAPDLAAKFARAREQCDAAIAAGDIDGAIQKAAALARGWAALDAAARAAGHTEAVEGVWCAEVGEGRPYAVCLHTADVGAVAAQFPGHTAVSLQELLRLLAATEAGRLVVKAKEAFPGAALTGIRPKKPTPDWAEGDPLPF